MPACRFCSRPCNEQWAVTVRYGQPPTDRWYRRIEYVCPRCNRELVKGGPRDGRKLKGCDAWWYPGHATHSGIPYSRAAEAMRMQGE